MKSLISQNLVSFLKKILGDPNVSPSKSSGFGETFTSEQSKPTA